jgi:predicted enzyme related to lactoylglutathione lyase
MATGRRTPLPPTTRTLAAGPCSRAARRWPDPGRSQHEHLDIRVDDIEAGQEAVLRLGARVLQGEQGTGFRVFADPAGHPFCLVY